MQITGKIEWTNPCINEWKLRFFDAEYQINLAISTYISAVSCIPIIPHKRKKLRNVIDVNKSGSYLWTYVNRFNNYNTSDRRKITTIVLDCNLALPLNNEPLLNRCTDIFK